MHQIEHITESAYQALNLLESDSGTCDIREYFVISEAVFPLNTAFCLGYPQAEDNLSGRAAYGLVPNGTVKLNAAQNNKAWQLKH